MTPTLSRSLAALAALGLVASPGLTAYAAERPHTHEQYAARPATVEALRTAAFPTTHLGVGPAPTIAYAFASKPEFGGGNWRMVRPDGTSLRLTDLPWAAWAPMGDGAIGMAGTEAGVELQQVSATGRVHSSFVQHFGLAVSPDRQIVGWLGDRSNAVVVEGGGTRRFAMPRVPQAQELGAIWGAQTCKEEAPEGGGCTVFVNRAHDVHVSTSHGIVTRVGPMLRVSDVNQHGRVTGLVSRHTASRPACWGVFGSGGRRVFQTCRYYLDSFSPDGRRVLAEKSQLKWSSVRRFAMLDRNGAVIRSWTFDPGRTRSLSQLVWEDAHHLLGVLQAHGRWGIVRIGTDGTVEYAGAPVAAANEYTPYDLPLT